MYLLFNEPFQILPLTDLFQHVPYIIVIVYIDLLLEIGHVILQPCTFISRLMIRLGVSLRNLGRKINPTYPRDNNSAFKRGHHRTKDDAMQFLEATLLFRGKITKRLGAQRCIIHHLIHGKTVLLPAVEQILHQRQRLLLDPFTAAIGAIVLRL